jgi:hypothetical protein
VERRGEDSRFRRMDFSLESTITIASTAQVLPITKPLVETDIQSRLVGELKVQETTCARRRDG